MDSQARLDKWLWAARFFKTRSLAKSAIEGGKVHYEGQRVKPSRAVQVGGKLKIRQGFYEKQVVIKEISIQRGPASVAQTLYEETAESIQKREAEVLLRKQQRQDISSRPDKKQRRQIHRFKNLSEPE